MRKDIEFKTGDGTILRGWLYGPQGASGPAPAIVMSHGYSATKEMLLEEFAEVFAKAGFAVLVYDNRNLGDSGGEPRGEIDPWQQIADYRDAITYAASLPEVDENRIGIWGSSYSGGHVLVVAAIDRRVKCVVSQVALISGLETARRLIRGDYWAALRAGFEGDRQAIFNGEPPAMIPVVGENPGDPCALPTDDSREFFMEISKTRATSWVNAVTLRSVEMFTEYEPVAYVAHISPTPLMLVGARGDHLTPFDLIAGAYEKALQPKKLLALPGGHFEAYTDERFAISAPAQCDWFLQHLTA